MKEIIAVLTLIAFISPVVYLILSAHTFHKKLDKEEESAKYLVEQTIKQCGEVDILLHESESEIWTEVNGIKICSIDNIYSGFATDKLRQKGFYGLGWNTYYHGDKAVEVIVFKRPMRQVVKEFKDISIEYIGLSCGDHRLSIYGRGRNKEEIAKYIVEDYRRGANLTREAETFMLSIKDQFEQISYGRSFTVHADFRRKPIEVLESLNKEIKCLP